MCMMRLWLVGDRGKRDDPVALAVKDPQSLAVGALLAVGFPAAVLVPSGSARMLNFNELFHLSVHSRGQ